MDVMLSEAESPDEFPWNKSRVKGLYPAKVHQFNKMLKKYKVSPLMYLQVAGDCQKFYAEEYFKDSLAIMPGGKKDFSFIDCYLTNSDLSTEFGKDISRQVNGCKNMQG